MIMFFHKELGLGFGCEPKTGSRIVRDHLEARDFIRIGGHHQSPEDILMRNRPSVGNNEVWWGEHLHYCSAVRNPFDLIHSWLAPKIHRGQITTIGIKQIEDSFHHKRNRIHFPHEDRFFRHLLIKPRARIPFLRYETLREDLDRLFKEYDLPPIIDWKINHQYLTTYKARGDKAWRKVWEPEAAEWFSNKYRFELETLGYSF